ncbi:hypothetical protein ABT300_34075 [Streptomyces sp. NPDC001027]|uniref:hypothetical protein n=1 Tax=Streptomyces sp. NPDC001027 TaxID=3154771 RepID=UPI0033189D5C
MDKHGRLAFTNDVGVAIPPSANSQGVIDLAVTGNDDRFVCVQNAVSGTVEGFPVGKSGALTKVSTTTGAARFRRVRLGGHSRGVKRGVAPPPDRNVR